MNYYEHHLGDYAEATAHLSFVEDSAYSRCIRKYYSTERPLPADVAVTQRLIGARTQEERDAVTAVLHEFFELRDDGWHQDRCDAEIARFQAKSRSAKASANARWSHTERNANASGNGCESDANAMQTQSDGNALQSPVSSPQSPKEKTVVVFDPSTISGLDVEAWHEWVEYRHTRRPAIKPESRLKAATALAKLGGMQRSTVDHSIANGYQGLIEPKHSGKAGKVTLWE